MRDLRIEIVDEGDGIYVAVDPDGLWARSTEVDERVTVDWDRQGRVIGIEVSGSAARAAVKAMFEGLSRAKLDDQAAWASVLTELGLGSTPDANGERRSQTATASSPKRPSKRKSGKTKTRSSG